MVYTVVSSILETRDPFWSTFRLGKVLLSNQQLEDHDRSLEGSLFSIVAY